MSLRLITFCSMQNIHHQASHLFITISSINPLAFTNNFNVQSRQRKCMVNHVLLWLLNARHRAHIIKHILTWCCLPMLKQNQHPSTNQWDKNQHLTHLLLSIQVNRHIWDHHFRSKEEIFRILLVEYSIKKLNPVSGGIAYVFKESINPQDKRYGILYHPLTNRIRNNNIQNFKDNSCTCEINC